MSSVNRGMRTASRSLRLHPITFQRIAPLTLSSRAVAAKLGATTPLTHPAPYALRSSSFSTTAAQQSAHAMPQEAREYDPEIRDIASYVTKPINSELAVCTSPYFSFVYIYIYILPSI